MAAFTAQDVKTLREKTGCGMMDCKKALTNADGDMDKAIDFLREQGLAKAAKKASRIAAEGVAYATTNADASVGVVIEVNAETDFVAKNDSFMDFVKACAQTVIEQNPADVDELLTLKAAGSEQTVAELLQEKIQTIGENIKIRRFTRYEGDVATYIHAGGSIGVMVKFDTDVADKEGFEEYGKDVAMQIAAMSPAYLDRASVPASVIEHESEIIKAQLAEDPKMAGKPDQVLAKIAEGKVGKYYKENCLLEQEFVKDGSMNVQKYVDSVAKKLGADIKVTAFIRYAKGEGLEKKEENFADEIANMVKG